MPSTSSRSSRFRSRVRVGAYATLFTAMLGAPEAYAACSQADLAGTWRVYIRTNSDYLKCKIVTDASGKIIKAQSSCKEPKPSQGRFAVSGKLTMSNTAECTVTGNLSFDGETLDFTGALDEGTMSRDKIVIQGAGEFSNGVNFDFDAVKK